MELVKGISITEYCAHGKLGVAERLDLFINVCQAVQHAHQKGIIHRDIKPLNIIVTMHDGVPVPKVIDFGIAKATQQELTERTIYTQYSQFIGTPAYMSPEQAEMSGLDIDTRSDIYSLGVLLYELLTGSTPFDTKELMQSGLDEMRKVIREQYPVKPSTRLSQTLGQGSRHADRRVTNSSFSTDLDWIVMKCLEKDRSRRYDTATGLVMDLRRHLNDEPIVARPPNVLYRLQKAWRRNKLAISAVVAVMAALVLGASISAWQMWRAIKAEKAQKELYLAEQEASRRAASAQTSAEAAQASAEVERDQARRSLCAASVNLAHRSWLQSNLGKARRLLRQSTSSEDEEDLRGWEWRYLWGLVQGDDLGEVARFKSGVWHLSFGGDDRYLTVGLSGESSEEVGGFATTFRRTHFLIAGPLE